MKLVFGFIIGIMSLMSCSTSLPEGFVEVNGSYNTANNQCDELFKDINKKWLIHDSLPCYYFNQDLLVTLVKSKSCFIGLDTSQIVGLLGIPTSINDDYRSATYKLSPICDEYFNGQPFTLNFQFENYTVKKVTYGVSYLIY